MGRSPGGNQINGGNQMNRITLAQPQTMQMPTSGPGGM